MSESPVTVGDPAWALAQTAWHYCRNVGAKGLPTPSLLSRAIRDLVTVIQEHAWDDACEETHGRGHIHDEALVEMRGRNPYRRAGAAS